MFKKLIIYFCIFTLSLSLYLIITWFKDKNDIKNMTNIISDNVSINNTVLVGIILGFIILFCSFYKTENKIKRRFMNNKS